MTKKALGSFLWTYDKPNSTPNPNPNPNPNKEKRFFFKKACELASVSLKNQSKMTQKAMSRSQKLVKDDTKSCGQILVDI